MQERQNHLAPIHINCRLMLLTHNPLLWGKGVRDKVLQIWTAGHFSLYIGVTVQNLQEER